MWYTNFRSIFVIGTLSYRGKQKIHLQPSAANFPRKYIHKKNTFKIKLGLNRTYHQKNNVGNMKADHIQLTIMHLSIPQILLIAISSKNS